MASATRKDHLLVAFYLGGFMDLFVYSDESGVFDQVHKDYFVFGGLICLGKEQKDIISRKYIHVERVIRAQSSFKNSDELKACKLNGKQKANIYRSLNSVYKFSVVIEQKKVNSSVFSSPKHKQRYLDFCYKLTLKKALKCLIYNKKLNPDEVENIHIYCDEHTTATDGIYELKEALFNEFKIGTFNFNYDHFYEPIFPKMKGLDVHYCNSATTTLVRAADIIANRVYYEAFTNKGVATNLNYIFIMKEPSHAIVKNGLDCFNVD